MCQDFFAYNRGKGTLYDGETRLFLRSNGTCMDELSFFYVGLCHFFISIYLTESLIHFIGKPVFMYSMGGMAEYCVVPSNGLAVLPNSLSYTKSAILGCAVFTAYGAMRNAAEMRAGDTVAVIGIGGVGSRCVSNFIYHFLCLMFLIKQVHFV